MQLKIDIEIGEKMSLGERIVELRTSCGLSQYKLAQEMDVSRQAVSKWETDQTSPDASNLIRLAEILDTDIEYLTTGRRNFGRRPPVVIKTTETVERIVEKPIYIEKIVEIEVEKQVVEYVEKPVIKKVFRTKYVRDPIAILAVGVIGCLAGILLGWLLL